MNTYASFNFSSQSWNSGSLSDNYQNSFTYDANGNILTQYRKTAKSSNKVQDQLTYHYHPHTNQLTYVSDAVDQNHYTNDIDDQASDNYSYDEIGNLVKDKSEEIDTILWTVYGKLKEIRRVDTSSKPWLAFEYNPSGQRAVKIVKPDHNDQLSWIYTYYIYDATGNVMATYTRRNYFDDIGDSSFAFVNDWIYNELGLTDLQDFVESKFNYNGQFMNDWIEYLSTNELASGVFDEFSPDDFLGWDATLVPAVLSNFAHSPNASPTENDALLNAILSNQQSNFVSSVLNSGIAVLNNALTAILSNDPTDLLLNCMATNNPVGLNSVYVSLGGSPVPPPTNASRIAYIRSFPPPTIASQISAIESISNLQNYFSSCLNSTMIYNSWNSSQPNISFTDLFDAWSGLGDTSLILDVLQNHYSNDAHLRILLKEVRTLQQLYQLASSSNYSSFVSNSINATSYQDLSFVMYQSSALTFSSYLKLVRTHFGITNYSNMMSDIGEWLKFGKDILLQEQHIYGSSRLGMYQSNQLLVKYKYKYSDTLQIYLDSVKFDRDTNRAMRKLSHKQYELTNHLGNVLSTVLDRKIPITSSGGSTTITHYEGDVVFASDYYPFGSSMSWTTSDSSGGMLYSGGGYRYGFNGQEKDDEIGGSGNSYGYGERQYDSRLGRFMSLDPRASDFTWQSPYVFAANIPIMMIDENGEGATSPVPLTRDAFVKMASDAGIMQGSMDRLRFNKTIGYAFEKAFINARTMMRSNYRTVGGVRPDVLGPSIYQYAERSNNTFMAFINNLWLKQEYLTDANAYEVKATKGDIKLSRQIKGEIDLVASSKSTEGTYATDVGLANLTIVTFAGVNVDPKVIAYSQQKNVNLMHITGKLNKETGNVTFSTPAVLNVATPTKAGVFNTIKATAGFNSYLTSETQVDWKGAAEYSNAPFIGTNESGNDNDCSYNEPCSGP